MNIRALVQGAIVVAVGLMGSGCWTFSEAPQASLFAGTERVDMESYVDPKGRFTLTVPEAWIFAVANTEVQWFVTDPSGAVRIKVALFEETRPLETLEQLSEEDQSTQTQERFYSTEVNGIHVRVREAKNAFGPSQTYYYGLESSVIALVAMEGDVVTAEQRALLHVVFTSFRAIP